MDDKNTKNTTNEFSLSQYLTYVGPFLIFLGMTRLITFYNSFGVSITSYLNISEVLTSFFDIIILVVIFFTLLSIQNFLVKDKNDMEIANKKRQAIIEEVSFLKICLLYLNYFSNLIIYGLIVVFGFIIAHYCFNLNTTFTVSIWTGAFVFLLIFLIIQVEIERKHIQFNSSVNKKRFIFFILYFLVFTYGVILYSSYQAGQIRRDKSTFGVNITLDNNQTLVSDSSNYFIGKTQNYVFIYHEKESKTDIIPMTRVKQITMIHIQYSN
ncbi:MAG: hypothetical protein WCO13_06200 [Bacteroidota bacterium]